ncbi:MAG: PKD domain-containing protein [Acidobacteria bacterium]|nr:PKD domain-containing protein [Acidobacteriota bacterium]
MSSTRSRRGPLLHVIVWLVLAIAARPAAAATYRIPQDGDLVRKAAVVVRGVVEKVESSMDREGAIHTDATVTVARVLKGSRVASTIVVRQPGGRVGDRVDVVPGIGSLAPHEEVLLLLDRLPGGAYRLTDFALGKFHVGLAPDGSRFLRRDGLGEATVLGAAIDPDRDAVGFERFVGALATGPASSTTYVLDARQTDAGARIDFSLFIDPNNPAAARWNQFDTGTPVVYKDNATGDADPNHCPTGCHAQVAAGVEDWNGAPGAQVMLSYGGTDSTIGSKCFNQLVNQIQFNDPCGDMSPLNLSNCTGTLAIGGYAATSLGGASIVCSTDPNGPTSIPFLKITKGAIVINKGTGHCLSSCDLEDAVAHETGHTLGSGHSTVGQALMFAFLSSGRCGNLQPDDVDFAVCAYPQQNLTCNVSASPTTGRAPLPVVFNSHAVGGVAPYTFAWDFGDGGQDTAALPSHSYLAPGMFTAAVTVTDANSQTCLGSIPIDVQPCLAPVVTSVTPATKAAILKAVVVGTGFRNHAVVQIDSGGGFVSAPLTRFVTRKKVVGKDVAAIWPAGIQVMVRVLSPTGCPSNAVAVTR